MDFLSLAARIGLMAKWRIIAMFLAPNPFRSRDWSSAKPTSSIECRLFSTAQWPRTAW